MNIKTVPACIADHDWTSDDCETETLRLIEIAVEWAESQNDVDAAIATCTDGGRKCES